MKKKRRRLNDYYLFATYWSSSLNYNRIINIISSFDEHAHKPNVVAQGSKRVILMAFKCICMYFIVFSSSLARSLARTHTLTFSKKEVNFNFYASGFSLQKRDNDDNDNKTAFTHMHTHTCKVSTEKKRQYFTPFKLIFRSASLSVR